ncbi:MAG: DUF368 domain-containing protein [Clostridia bacterium]|nr:DUF368 domain-containing protein [Clostridia bacterium]
MKDAIISFLKGLWIGGTMTVPGVSGGAMAMIMGVYDRLIYSVSHLFKEFKKSVIFLIEFAIGGVIGFVLLAKAITWLLESPTFSVPFHFFFVGAIAGGIPIIFKSAKVKKFSPACIICPVIGIVLVVLIWMIPQDLFHVSFADNKLKYFAFQIFAGILAAIALVIPGISLTQIFAMLGIYGDIMAVVGNMDIKGILRYVPLGIVAVLGTYLLAKALEPAMKYHPTVTYLLIFGFLLGSIPQLLSDIHYGIGSSAGTWLLCAVAAVAGFFALYYMSRVEIKRIEAAQAE